MDELIDPARHTLAFTQRILEQHRLSYVPLGEAVVGVGLGVPFAVDSFVVISVAAGGLENTINLTVGVLKNVQPRRAQVLDACNALTRDNAAYPYFLHDAELGWDVLVQTRLPVSVVANTSDYLVTLVRGLPQYARAGREQIAAIAGGEPYLWNNDDCRRLLLRSLL